MSDLRRGPGRHPRLRRFLLSTGQRGSVKLAGHEDPRFEIVSAPRARRKKRCWNEPRRSPRDPERAERRKERQEIVAARNAQLAERKSLEEEARRREAAERAARKRPRPPFARRSDEWKKRPVPSRASRGGRLGGPPRTPSASHSGRPAIRAKSPQTQGQTDNALRMRALCHHRSSSASLTRGSLKARRWPGRFPDQARGWSPQLWNEVAAASVSSAGCLAHLLRDIDQRRAPRRRIGRTPPFPRR